VPGRLRLTYRKSSIGYPKGQKDTIRLLGFHKLYSTIEKDDTPSIRGMVQKVTHLVQVDEIPSESGVTATGEQV